MTSHGGDGKIYRVGERVACGSSCAPAGENYSGTFGALVKYNNELYAISNNHVFSACNHVPDKMPIMSPANADSFSGLDNHGKPSGAPQAFCYCDTKLSVALHSGCPSFVTPNKLDLSFAKIIDQDKVSSWQGDSQQGYDRPSSWKNPCSRMAVKKFGRSTGLTHGIIQYEILDQYPIYYQSRHISGWYWFNHSAWIAKPLNDEADEAFATYGDSGSLVVTEDGNFAVGMVFAIEENKTYILPMEDIMKQHNNLRLVNNHGISP